MESFLKKAINILSKYRYVVLILLIGVILMLLPTSGTEEETSEPTIGTTQSLSIAEELSEILAQIQGVGKVKVMLTVRSSEHTVYHIDDDGTVVITGVDRGQNALVEYVEAPVYLGAIVVCQGGDRPTIQLQIVEAVSNVTGLNADRITVLKMK